MKNKNLVIVLTVLMILSLGMPVRAIEIIPDETTKYYCVVEDSIQYDIDEHTENCILLLPGYSLWCNTDIDIGYFWGSEFPILMQVLHPSSLLQDCKFQTNYSASGQDGARIGAELHSDVCLALELRDFWGNGVASWSLFDDTRGFNFVLDLKTPLGEMNTSTIEERIRIASLPLKFEAFGFKLDTEITAYIGAVIDTEVEGTLESQLKISGAALSEEQTDQLIWDEKDEVHSRYSETTVDGTGTVEITQTDIQFKLTTYTASIRNLYITFEFIGFDIFTLPIPIPFDLLSVDMSGQVFDIDPMNTIPMQLEVPEPSMTPQNDPMVILLIGIIGVTVLMVIALRRDD